ncbi:MAG TPA: 50S ribosomal protein L35 [Spirochaetia bacterium]|nr:50S ribosomal protein L35 [Spirochaetia bacterium]
MAKLKSHRGACKRFKKTGTGKIKAKHACARHLLTGKSMKRKRKHRNASVLSGKDAKNISILLT